MKNVYLVGKSERGFTTLVIERLPSEIPRHVDETISKLGCVVALMDGPNGRVTYEFRAEVKFPLAEKYLQEFGWTRSDTLEKFSDMGRQHARSLSPEIQCYITGSGWWRSEAAKDWTDEECRAFAAAYDLERGALYHLSQGCGL